MNNMKTRIIGGFKDTRDNEEDFALTPYLFIVNSKSTSSSVYGIGICWGYYSFYLVLGFNIPKEYPTFRNLSKK